jgi:WD40 repeat protein
MTRSIGSLFLVLFLSPQGHAGVSQDSPHPASLGRLDLHGDPLPVGAVARLGNSRFNPGNFVLGVAYTPDGKGLISFGADGHVRVWDAGNGRPLRTLIPDGSEGSREFALTADGKRMLTVERSSSAHYRIWDFATGRELSRVPVPDPKPYLWQVVYSPDGRTVATLALDRFIEFRDGTTLAALRRIEVGRATIAVNILGHGFVASHSAGF